MPKINNLSGKSFHRLTAISHTYTNNGRRKRSAWVCICTCGNTTTVTTDKLTSGHSKSCGCLKRELSKKRSTTHGMFGTRTRNIWGGMHQRCNNPNNSAFQYYGNRGISVCSRWNKFETFVADMGACPDGHTIDRIDNDGDYTPENCRWATPKTQANNRSSNKLITFNGETMNASQWSIRTGISVPAIYARLKRGWSIERTLTQKVRLIKNHPVHLS